MSRFYKIIDDHFDQTKDISVLVEFLDNAIGKNEKNIYYFVLVKILKYLEENMSQSQSDTIIEFFRKLNQSNTSSIISEIQTMKIDN